MTQMTQASPHHSNRSLLDFTARFRHSREPSQLHQQQHRLHHTPSPPRKALNPHAGPVPVSPGLSSPSCLRRPPICVGGVLVDPSVWALVQG